MGKKIVVAGHVCLDITPIFPVSAPGNLQQVLVPGRLVSLDGANVHTGGIVSNFGLGLKKLGAEVSLMGKVGEDEFGKIILDIFSGYGLEKDMIVAKNVRTSYSIVLALPGMDRIFLHDSGANDTFGFEDIDFNKLKDAALFHFGYPPIMRRMYANEGQELLEIFKKVKEMGIATSLDLAAVDEKSEAASVDWKAVLQKTLPFVDFFVPSLEELAFMLDKDLYKTLHERAKDQDVTRYVKLEEIERLASECISYGTSIVLIKCGAPGMYLKTAQKNVLEKMKCDFIEDLEAWSNVSHFEKSYKPDCILSATGAGDTSSAAFLFGLTEGYSYEKCLQLATGTGAFCVTRYDAVSGLVSFDTIFEKIEKGWQKQNLVYEKEELCAAIEEGNKPC